MSDPIQSAITILTTQAEEIRDIHTKGDGDWTGEPEAKADYDQMISVVEGLKRLQAALSAPAAWRITFTPEGYPQMSHFHGHNCVLDYQQVDENATSTPLFDISKAYEGEM